MLIPKQWSSKRALGHGVSGIDVHGDPIHAVMGKTMHLDTYLNILSKVMEMIFYQVVFQKKRLREDLDSTEIRQRRNHFNASNNVTIACLFHYIKQQLRQQWPPHTEEDGERGN